MENQNKKCCDKCKRKGMIIVFCYDQNCPCHQKHNHDDWEVCECEKPHQHCWEVDEKWTSPCSVCGFTKPETENVHCGKGVHCFHGTDFCDCGEVPYGKPQESEDWEKELNKIVSNLKDWRVLKDFIRQLLAQERQKLIEEIRGKLPKLMLQDTMYADGFNVYGDRITKILDELK